MFLFAVLLGQARAASVTLSPGDDVAAFTSSLLPGDVIQFRAGTYTIPSRLTWVGLGTAEAPIKLQAEAGAEVILEGTMNDYVIVIDDSSYIEVRNLTIRQAEGSEGVGGIVVDDSSNVLIEDLEIGPLGRTAMYLAGDDSALTVRNNHMHDIGHGSALYAGCGDASCWLQGSTISGNWIHDVVDEYGYGLYIDNGGQDNTVTDNVIYNSTYRGAALTSTEYGPPNVFEGNAIWGVGDIGLLLTGTATVRNNLVFNVGGVGIYARDGGRDTLANLVIAHNTVANSDSHGVYVEGWAAREGMVLANNAVANPTGRAFYAGENHVSEQNRIVGNVFTGLVDGLDPLAGQYTPGNGFGDFMDASGWDFYPSAGSALVGAADPSSESWVPTIDFNGTARSGSSPDVGAYERTVNANPGWAIQEGFKELAGGSNSDPSKQVGGCCSDGGSEDSTAQVVFLLPFGLMGWRRRRC